MIKISDVQIYENIKQHIRILNHMPAHHHHFFFIKNIQNFQSSNVEFKFLHFILSQTTILYLIFLPGNFSF